MKHPCPGPGRVCRFAGGAYLRASVGVLKHDISSLLSARREDVVLKNAEAGKCGEVPCPDYTVNMIAPCPVFVRVCRFAGGSHARASVNSPGEFDRLRILRDARVKGFL